MVNIVDLGFKLSSFPLWLKFYTSLFPTIWHYTRCSFFRAELYLQNPVAEPQRKRKIILIDFNLIFEALLQHCIRPDQDMLWTQAWQKFIAVSELEPWCIWSWLMRQVVAAMQSVYLCLILQYLKTAITIVYWVFTESITAPPTRPERAPV